MVIARLVIVVGSILFIGGPVFGQTPAPTPASTPRSSSRPAAVPAVVRDKSSYDRLRTIERMTERASMPTHPMLDRKTGIYRKPRADESKALEVSEALVREFAPILATPDTGIVKLNGDASCFSGLGVVNVSEKCAPFKMPGAGTAFSFRTDGYRLPHLADVILYNGTFRADAVLQHVAMVDLGEVGLGEVTLDLPEMRYLVELQPSRDGDEFLAYDKSLAAGINFNGYTYRKGQPVKLGSTYALRSVAYRGRYLRAIDNITYNELDFDRRRDVIVAFRVVETDASGNVTIVWKRLKDAEAPKLNIKN